MVSAAALGVACTQPASPATSSAALEFSAAETVFVGFSNPVERISERLRLLYAADSAPLSIDARRPDETTVHAQVRSDAEEPNGTPGVRCFIYTLDVEEQQAHLEEFSDAPCPTINEGGANESAG